MNIQKIDIKNLKTAEYNPRRDLKTEDEEYKKIKKSIEEFGYVTPIIVNTDMTVIGGHQRLKVLKELGYTEVDCNVVNLDKNQEKALNIALNKISGDWDYDKLEDLLAELKEANMDLLSTGFDEKEIEKILRESEELINDNQEVDLSEFKDEKFQCKCPKCGFMFDIKK
ncbi:MAG: ParB N-terminal domain-containing protein [Clostridia bacterium]